MEENENEKIMDMNEFCGSLERLFKNNPTPQNIKATVWEYRFAIFEYLLYAAEENGYDKCLDNYKGKINDSPIVPIDKNDLD